MNQLTKQQQKKEAFETYEAIRDPAWEAYQAKLEQIDAQPDEHDQTLQDLMKKHGIEHGYENDQSSLDDFIAEMTELIKENK